MQLNEDLPVVDRAVIIQCFQYLYDNNSSSETRKRADQHLLQLQKNAIGLLTNLFSIFEDNSNIQLSFQALVYSCSVLKRNWNTRRYNKAHSEFDAMKKAIRTKLLEYICMLDKRSLVTLFDMTKFIAKIDFPHNYSTFSNFVMKMCQQIQINELYVVVFKEIKEIFYELGQRKGYVNKRHFEDLLRPILNAMSELSVNFKGVIQNAIQSNTLTAIQTKLSKYSDQIVVYILRMAPIDIMDEQFAKQATLFLMSKLQFLLTKHNLESNQPIRVLLQKNIKSLIYDFGLLQLSKPLILFEVLPDLYQTQLYVLRNYNIFVKNAAVRYSLIGIKRIIKEFAYYAEDSVFMGSIKSKSTSANCLQLRKVCNQFYATTISDAVVQQLLNFLIFNPLTRTLASQHSLFDLDEGLIIEKGHQKELSLQACVISLIQGLLERFTLFTHNLVKNMILGAIQNNWNNLDRFSLSNLLSVLAILPATCKKNEIAHLKQIPVLDILDFIYVSQSYKLKFATIVSGWMDAFDNQQLNSLTQVLLKFIENQSGNQQDAIDVLMGCCQCLNKIILQRSAAIDMQQAIQRVVPVSLMIFQKIDTPSVLWPMVTLISNIIVKVQFNTQLIVNSIDSSKLSLLITNKSAILVQALCDMLKGFLCVIPRQMLAKSVYELVCVFLNNHLSNIQSVNHQKIFHLWYIAIRQYSPIQQCDHLYVELFYNHFVKNLYRKTATLIYILEEYMLSGIIPNQIQKFVGIIIDCYIEAQQLEKDQKQKLKIASLSFQITLITKYNLQQLIIRDFFNDDISNITPTIRNSLISIINRYIILYKQVFFNYLSSINVSYLDFFQVYFKNMDYLTSHAAMKINAIALLSLMGTLERTIIIPQLHFILKLIIPQVENYYGTLQNSEMQSFFGRIDNSPSLRFASNTLSQRKQQIRKKDNFDNVDIGSYFREQLNALSVRQNVSIGDIANAFSEQSWSERLLKLL